MSGAERGPDPFDPNTLRLSQDFAGQVGVKKLLTTVPVKRPARHDFVCVHPDESYRLSPAAIIELKEEREAYLIAPDMATELSGEFAITALFMAITRQGVLSLWPVKLPGSDGKYSEWHRSAMEAAERAMTSWVRVSANMALGAYETSVALGNLAEPDWPDVSFAEVIKIAFRDRIVDRADHPLIQRLRGEF